MKFETRKLGELVINFDRKRVPLSSRQRSERQGVYPYYGATSIMDYVDNYIFDGKYLLMGEDGTVIDKNGKPILQIAEGKFWCNNHAHILQNTELVTFDYLYYLLKNTNVQSLVTGAVQPKISQSNMNKLVLRIHKNKKEQEKIARYLRLLDDKIELNSAINNNLEQQAKALYKDWFFDFSPFSIEGNLPDGWHLGTVGDIIQLHDSKRVPLSGSERDKMEKIYPYYGATSLMDYVDNYLFDGIYLLLGEDGTVVDSLGFPILQYVYGQFWVNNHAHIITGKEGFSVEELYLFFSLTNIKSIVTGAVQQKVSQQNLKKVPAIIPSKEALSAFDDLIQPVFAQIRNLRDENAHLADLRDTLLPRLMSGELDVSNIEI